MVHAGCTPHFLFHLVEKKTGRARSKRKDRFWSQLCTCVQSCCTGVGVRGCLRVCEDWTTGAAGCRADLVVDSRGAVHLGSGCKDAVPLSARSASLRAALAGVGAVALSYAETHINHRPAAAKREATQCDDHPDEVGTIRHGTAVSTWQKAQACPKARQNRSRHRYADPRSRHRYADPVARGGPLHRSALSALFFWTVHGPFSFRARPKRKWGVHPGWTSPPAGAETPWPPSGGPYHISPAGRCVPTGSP